MLKTSFVILCLYLMLDACELINIFIHRGRRNLSKYAENGCHCAKVRCVDSMHFYFELIVIMTAIGLVVVSKVRCQFNP